MKLFVRNNHAVSETLGSMLMVAAAITFTSVVTLVILNPWVNYSDQETRFSTLYGYVDTGSDEVIFLHQGGEPIPTSARVVISYKLESDPSLSEVSFLLSEILSQDEWSVGEEIQKSLVGDLDDYFIRAEIIDTELNAVIFDKVLQDIPQEPYVISYQPDQDTIGETSVKLKLYYSFINQSYYEGTRKITFIVEPVDLGYDPDDLVITDPSTGLDGTILTTYYGDVEALSPGTDYHFYGKIEFTRPDSSEDVYVETEKKLFSTYSNLRAYYSFDADTPPGVKDSQKPFVDGFGEGVEYYSHDAGKCLVFDDLGDYVEIPHHSIFNLSDRLTITGELNPDISTGEYEGSITEISTKQDIFNLFYQPDIIKITEDIYAIVTWGKDQTGYSAAIFTVEINDDTGQITQEVLSSKILDFNQEYYAEPCIHHVSGDWYVIAFGATLDQSNPKGNLITVNINSHGVITEVTEPLTFETYYGSEPNIVRVSNDLFAIVYAGECEFGAPSGRFLTIEITDDGVILANTLKDETTLSADRGYVFCLEADIEFVTESLNGRIYLVSYAQANNEMLFMDSFERKIEVVEITRQGIVNRLSQWKDNPSNALEPEIYPVYYGDADDDKTFVIAYGTGSNIQNRDGWMQTVRIGARDHSIGLIDSYVFNKECSEMSIEQVDNGVFTVAYTDIDQTIKPPEITTFAIDNDGRISDSPLCIFTHALTSRLEPSSVQISGNTLAICYGETSSLFPGFISSIKIGDAAQIYSIIKKPGSFEIGTDGTRIICSVTGASGQVYSVDGDLEEGWNFFSMYYGGSRLNLKLNSAQETLFGCESVLQTTSNPIRFGPYLGSLDEVRILREPS